MINNEESFIAEAAKFISHDLQGSDNELTAYQVRTVLDMFCDIVLLNTLTTEED